MKSPSRHLSKDGSPAVSRHRRESLRVLYFGTYREEYSRNRILIEGLRQNGVQVIECHETLWRSIEDRVQLASGGWRHPEFWQRAIRAYLQLLKKYFRSGDYDVMVVGYPGPTDIFLGWLLSRLKRRPLCWDILMSIYLVAMERKLDRFSPFTIRMLSWIEWVASRLPDRLVLESPEYVQWFCEQYHLSPDRFGLVPLGTNLDFIPPPAEKPDEIFRVVYFGSFIPNHGVEKMVGAARELAGDEMIQFEMIGTGPELDRVKAQAAKAGLENVTFLGWLDQDQFSRHLANADIVLGIFGETPQSMMTIQNKIYECLAMGKPLITGESPLIRRTFEHGKHMFICQRTPQSLAEGIRTLRENRELCETIAREGNAYFNERFQVKHIGRMLLDCLEDLLS